VGVRSSSKGHRRRVAGALSAAVLAAGLIPGVANASATQNSSRPSTGPALSRQLTTLWRAIGTDSATLSRRVFFPEGPYLSMKSGKIPDPAADYRTRLVALYDLDVAAYHRWAGGARLVRVNVNPGLATWIAPGACENRIGYWHLPGVRLVLARHHRLWSVGVFSLISWRGVYYVVHLGPNPRVANVGTLDDPRLGAGGPGPGGGC
jgi:hypothetical protein